MCSNPSRLAVMTVDFQASLFDGLVDTSAGPPQGSSQVTPTVGALAGHVERHPLSRGAWVDVRPAWVTGSDEVFERLVRDVPWQAERRQMYDRVVDVPRLLCFYGEDARLPLPILDEARDSLSRYYADELGEPFRTAGLCFYRDGRDSVAWHGDRIGRGNHEDTMVAILSVGEPRVLALRPRPGSAQPVASTVRYPLGHGDLIVMGGSCQ